MMKSSFVSIILIGLCSWLGWLTYDESRRPVPSTASIVPQISAEPTRDQSKSNPEKTAVIFPPLDTLGDITARPLFNVSRRPIAVEKPTPEAKAAEINLMLSGIVIGQTGQIAHLRSTADKQTQALSVGDKIGDWQIQSIFPDRVVLRSGRRIETLFMQKPGARSKASGRPKSERDKSSARRKKARSNRRTRRINRRNRRRGEQ